MVFDGKIKHLVLFDYELLHKICDKIKYVISKKSGSKNSINYNLERSKLIHVIFCLLKRLTFHNIMIPIKSVLNKNKNKYYYNIILEKVSFV